MTGMRRVLRIAGVAVAAVLALVVLFVVFLTVNEYRPADEEAVQISHKQKETDAGHEISVLTFNIGYAGLGRNEDFFMDGGEKVCPDSADTVNGYLEGIERVLENNPADVVFLQEVDRNSKRSYGIDEAEALAGKMPADSAFAYNFKAAFVPYPIPPIGKVESGLMTFSGRPIREARRVALPIPFSWPVSTCNLKRCLLVCRLPYQARELVLVNLHLEAYDEGEGKTEQTKVLVDYITDEYEKGNYVIAGGDVNQEFPNEASYLRNGEEDWMPGIFDTSLLQKGWQIAVDSSVPTCRLLNKPYDGKSNTLYVIDGFLLSPNIELTSVETLKLDFEFSDHNPVRVTAKLK